MRRFVSHSLCFLLLAGGYVALAQSRQPAGMLVLRAARLLDVRAGAVVHDAVVIVEGNKIKAAGSNLPMPHGARVVDLGDVTLLPGLIDCHTHLLLAFDGDKSDEDSGIATITQMSTAKRALLGAANAREMLDAGFTTVRDLGNSGNGGDLALRDAINAGWVPGPRMLVSTRALAPVGGQAPRVVPEAQGLINQEYAVITGTNEARRAVRQAAYDGADWIKVIVDGSANTLSLEEMSAIVDEAHTAGLRVAAHATSDAALRIAATAGVDSIEHAYEVSDATLALMSAKKIFLVPTDGPVGSYLESANMTAEQRAQAEERMKPFVAGNQDRLRRAIKAGVRIAAGSDVYYRRSTKTRGQASLRMLEAYAADGMPPIDVVRAATLNAADLLRLPTGSIEAGLTADIIAVRGDPLKDVSSLKEATFVMKGGRIEKEILGH
jgi:imidazolonepropionase-like amidohydrolase